MIQGFPKKKEYIDEKSPKYKELENDDYIHNMLNGERNDTIDECESAVMKKLDKERIRRIIIDKELVPTVCEDSGQAEWTVGESNKLAQAIVDYMKGGVVK